MNTSSLRLLRMDKEDKWVRVKDKWRQLKNRMKTWLRSGNRCILRSNRRNKAWWIRVIRANRSQLILRKKKSNLQPIPLSLKLRQRDRLALPLATGQPLSIHLLLMRVLQINETSLIEISIQTLNLSHLEPTIEILFNRPLGKKNLLNNSKECSKPRK